MSIFSDLCSIATDDDVSPSVAEAIDEAIKRTEQGRELISLIAQYNDGCITIAEFRNLFITTALK